MNEQKKKKEYVKVLKDGTKDFKIKSFVSVPYTDSALDYPLLRTCLKCKELVWANTDGKLFYYITASGCSCWDGDYDEEVFNDFESLRRFVLNEDMPQWNPSINGAKALVEEAERKLGL